MGWRLRVEQRRHQINEGTLTRRARADDNDLLPNVVPSRLVLSRVKNLPLELLLHGRKCQLAVHDI